MSAPDESRPVAPRQQLEMTGRLLRPGFARGRRRVTSKPRVLVALVVHHHVAGGAPLSLIRQYLEQQGAPQCRSGCAPSRLHLHPGRAKGAALAAICQVGLSALCAFAQFRPFIFGAVDLVPDISPRPRPSRGTPAARAESRWLPPAARQKDRTVQLYGRCLS